MDSHFDLDFILLGITPDCAKASHFENGAKNFYSEVAKAQVHEKVSCAEKIDEEGSKLEKEGIEN